MLHNVAAGAASGPLAASPALAQRTALGRRIYGDVTRRKKIMLGLLGPALILLILADISIGPSGLTILDVARIIVMPSSANLTQYAIVWEIRLPMALMAVVVGVSLAIAGAEMQTILNNPLASPFTLGISAAASFGAAIALVLGVSLVPFADGLFFVAGNAFIFAMLAALIIFAFSMMRGVTAETMVLLGIALVFLFNALLAATPVAFVGTIGFVGLVGPHVARMLVGEDQRYFLPTSAVAGALLLSLTSIVSKSIIPGVLIPIGIITSLIGVPFFMSMIFMRRRQLWS